MSASKDNTTSSGKMASASASPAPRQVPHLKRRLPLGKTTELMVSPLCLSTGQMTRFNINQVGATDVLDKFYQLGGNFIDTKPGQSEKWVGDWMAARKNRGQVILSAKYGDPVRKPEELAKPHTRFDQTIAKAMKGAFETSLKNLQTDYVDILTVVWGGWTTGLDVLMKALYDLVTAGEVLYLGIMDAPAWIVARAQEYARQEGLRTFSVYFGLWSRASRDIEREIAPVCAAENMAICAVNRGEYFASTKEQPCMPPPKQAVSATLLKIAQAHNTNDGYYAELAYVRQKASYVFPVVAYDKTSIVDAVASRLSIRLSEEEMQMIDAAYEFDAGYPHTTIKGTMFSTGQ